MGRQAAKPSDRAIPGGMDGPASPTTRQVHPGAPPASEPKALLAFAEELGRLVARRLLANPNRRRAYGLIEISPALAFNAVVLVLAYYLIAWLRR